MGNIKKKYDELKKKYSLPSFEEIDKEFEISKIEEDEPFLLHEAMKKVCEKIEAMHGILDKVLQPEAHIADMHECNTFSDDEKEKLYDLYKRLMWINRFAVENSMDNDDKKSAEFINTMWKRWAAVKKEFSTAVRKMKESWEKDSIYKEDLKYLG